MDSLNWAWMFSWQMLHWDEGSKPAPSPWYPGYAEAGPSGGPGESAAEAPAGGTTMTAATVYQTTQRRTLSTAAQKPLQLFSRRKDIDNLTPVLTERAAPPQTMTLLLRYSLKKLYGFSLPHVNGI